MMVTKICSKISEVSHVPIIILTALGHVQERIKGFEVGADDYIIKPFSPKELELRINSVLRRGRVKMIFKQKQQKISNW